MSVFFAFGFENSGFKVCLLFSSMAVNNYLHFLTIIWPWGWQWFVWLTSFMTCVLSTFLVYVFTTEHNSIVQPDDCRRQVDITFNVPWTQSWSSWNIVAPCSCPLPYEDGCVVNPIINTKGLLILMLLWLVMTFGTKQNYNYFHISL